jgi:hypothetical protein
MAYIKHDDKWWAVETAWVEQQALLPPGQRISQFSGYVEMQYHHCMVNGPVACVQRLEKVLEGIR